MPSFQNRSHRGILARKNVVAFLRKVRLGKCHKGPSVAGIATLHAHALKVHMTKSV